MSTRDEWVEKMKSKIDEANAEIDRLRDKSNKTSRDAQSQYQEYVDDLKQKRERAEQRLQELRNSSESAADDLRQGAENAWESIKNSVTAARNKF